MRSPSFLKREMEMVETIKILVPYGTVSISMGAEEMYKRLAVEVERRGLEVEIKRTGDRGYFNGLLVDVIHPSTGKITYELTIEDINPLIERHVIGGEVLEELRAYGYLEFIKRQQRIVLRRCGEVDPENIQDYIDTDGYKALERALKELSPQEVIEEVKKSGLRGRGGAGFPTGIKWEFCRMQEEEKYVICNADEGNPGDFMDRSIMEGDPHSVLEGLTIAGYAVGASQGYIYCREEYPLAIKRMQTAIHKAREAGFLGDSILGSDFSFDVKLVTGAGSYVCGEETALIESIEGRRGNPRYRPPYPTQRGLWEKPTVVNNVETLANIPIIVLRGGEWYASIGGGKGTKVLSISGKVSKPGLVEVPFGLKLGEILEIAGALDVKGVLLGGPLGVCIPSSLFETSLDFDSVANPGAGGLFVFDESLCVVELSRVLMEFSSSESCGKCFPCRLGLGKMYEILERIVRGEGDPKDLDRLKRLGRSIMETSLCGLGGAAPQPILSSLEYFSKEYEAHVIEKTCPAGVCSLKG
jgi:NADH:ubiquinone oxidoreductase subunit F (NADH-binding)